MIYQGVEGITVEMPDVSHVNDGVYVKITAPSNRGGVVMSVSGFGSGTYTESRALYNGVAEFNLAPYIQEATANTPRRFSFIGDVLGLRCSAFHAANVPVTDRWITSLSFTVDSVYTVNVPLSGVRIYQGYEADAREVRAHLFNPNFETICEFYTDKQDVCLSLTYNREPEALYQYRATGAAMANLLQFRLNDYWDDRYDGEGQTLAASIMEQGEVALYHLDTRTEGAFLRFTDGDGRLQQLLLDIESTARTYTDTDAVNEYDGNRKTYASVGGITYNGGSGYHARRTQQRVLHCSLSHVPITLADDVNALLMAPEVLMLVDGDKWQRVRVVCAEVREETKKRLLSVKIDVITNNAGKVWQ